MESCAFCTVHENNFSTKYFWGKIQNEKTMCTKICIRGFFKTLYNLPLIPKFYQEEKKAHSRFAKKADSFIKNNRSDASKSRLC